MEQRERPRLKRILLAAVIVAAICIVSFYFAQNLNFKYPDISVELPPRN